MEFHFTDEQITRSKEYFKYPTKYYPTMIEALSAINVAHIVDKDILRCIDLHYCVRPNGIPEYQVRYVLSDALIDYITKVQHSKLF